MTRTLLVALLLVPIPAHAAPIDLEPVSFTVTGTLTVTTQGGLPFHTGDPFSLTVVGQNHVPGILQGESADLAEYWAEVTIDLGAAWTGTRGLSIVSMRDGRWGMWSPSTGAVPFGAPFLPDGSSLVRFQVEGTHPFTNALDVPLTLTGWASFGGTAHPMIDGGDLQLQVTSIQHAPEPASLGLLGIGLLALVRQLRRQCSWACRAS